MSIANKYFLYLLSLAAYAYALTQPLFTTSGKLIGFEFSEEQITFFKTIEILEEQNYQVLKIALLVFVIGLPVIKFFTLLFNINNIILFTIKFDQFLISLQKYAMVDVFVISLLVIGAKKNPIFSMNLELGTYMLLVSVVASIFLSINISNKGKL